MVVYCSKLLTSLRRLVKLAKRENHWQIIRCSSVFKETVRSANIVVLGRKVLLGEAQKNLIYYILYVQKSQSAVQSVTAGKKII